MSQTSSRHPSNPAPDSSFALALFLLKFPPEAIKHIAVF
jgi:hypothetical protein